MITVNTIQMTDADLASIIEKAVGKALEKHEVKEELPLTRKQLMEKCPILQTKAITQYMRRKDNPFPCHGRGKVRLFFLSEVISWVKKYGNE